MCSAFWLALAAHAVDAQTQRPCGRDGYIVVAQRWDAVLKSGWESRQDCAHPEQPARMVRTDVREGLSFKAASSTSESAQPMLVIAGERIRLWFQDSHVRIEMTGIAEGSARLGERITVRIGTPGGETDTPPQPISATVSGAGVAEMDR